MRNADSIPTENTAEYFQLNHVMVSTKNARSAKQKSSSVNQQTVQYLSTEENADVKNADIPQNPVSFLHFTENNSRNSGEYPAPLSAVNGRTVLMRQTRKEVLNLKITIEAEAKEISDVMSAMKNQTFSKDINLFPQKKSYMSGELRNLLDSRVREAMKELNEQFKT